MLTNVVVMSDDDGKDADYGPGHLVATEVTMGNEFT